MRPVRTSFLASQSRSKREKTHVENSLGLRLAVLQLDEGVVPTEHAPPDRLEQQDLHLAHLTRPLNAVRDPPLRLNRRALGEAGRDDGGSHVVLCETREVGSVPCLSAWWPAVEVVRRQASGG